jgi:uroporphyrinogen-III synthase
MKIKSILISQPKPESERSPYFDLSKSQKVQLDFQPFLKVEGVEAAELRKHRVDFNEYNCIVLTSKNAVDHYFRLASEMRYQVSENNKYFCTTEAIALYLQKYIVYRKRKIFHGTQGLEDITDTLKKNKEERFLFPCSDKHRDKVTILFESLKLKFNKAVFYKTVFSDMNHLDIYGYDMLIFFSPNGIESLMHNFPEFDQKHLHIGVFGNGTRSIAESHGLVVHLEAPMPKAPSMNMALEWYLTEKNGKK